MSHDRERLSGLASMRHPQTASELMQFLQAVNWLQTSLPRWQRLSSPFECCWKSTWREFALNRAIVEEAWTREQVVA